MVDTVDGRCAHECLSDVRLPRSGQDNRCSQPILHRTKFVAIRRRKRSSTAQAFDKVRIGDKRLPESRKVDQTVVDESVAPDRSRHRA